MAERTCLWCGVSIANRPKGAMFCCAPHKQKAHYWKNPEKCRARNRTPKQPPKPCKECGEEFIGIRGAKYCGRKCTQARSNRKQAELRQRQPDRKFECGFCGAQITTRSGIKKYCSISCRKRAMRSLAPTYTPHYPVERDLVGKVCCRCGEYRLFSDFPRSKRAASARTDGLASHCKDCRRVTRKMQRYALTESEVLRLMEISNCEICESVVSVDGAHIDHCHKTGAVRGVLCHTCNTGIGGLQDSPEFLSSAAQYLLRSVDVLAMAGQLTGREAI
jgi:hypothetical protein